MKKLLLNALRVLAVAGVLFSVAGCKDSPAPSIKINMINIPEKDYCISETELTYAKWYEVYNWAVSNGYVFEDLGREGVKGTDGAAPKTSTMPVGFISWRDAVVWCNAASEKEGLQPVYTLDGQTVKIAENYDDGKDASHLWGTNKENTETKAEGEGSPEKAAVSSTANGYRLPTVEEWTYAAKGGKEYEYSGSNNPDEVAVYYEESSDWTTASGDENKPEACNVKSKAANDYGLYDMSGNMNEYCYDIANESTKSRTAMGGGCNATAEHCKIASVTSDQSYARNYGFNGIRLARTVYSEK